MSKLLYVNSSPRGELSESRRIAEEFLTSYRAGVEDLSVDRLDLWSEQLPVYGGPGVAAKMNVFAGQEPSGQAADAWAEVKEVFARVQAADEYLFTVPMWNHSIPWVLKQLIDTISQPGMVFSFDPATGYRGLLAGRRAIVVYTGGVYFEGAPPAFGVDFHRSYFNDWLRWAGIEDITELRFQPDLVTDDADGARDVGPRRRPSGGPAPAPTRTRVRRPVIMGVVLPDTQSSGEQLADLGEIELCYETFGDDGDPPLLLIMGLATQMIWWEDDFCRQLADRGFWVTRFDNRDIGRSTILSDNPVPTRAAAQA